MSPFMTTPFNELLASALAPITLISGVGLLMLSMSARYNHATTRIRLLMNERLDPKLSDDGRACRLRQQHAAGGGRRPHRAFDRLPVA